MGHFIKQLTGIRKTATFRIGLNGAIEQEDRGLARGGEEVGFKLPGLDEGTLGGAGAEEEGIN